MEELLELLERATNVSSVTFDKRKGNWTVEFYNGEPNEVESDILFDFLENA